MRDQPYVAYTPKTSPKPRYLRYRRLQSSTGILYDATWRRINMIAQELEVSLHLAFVEARQKRHEFITVEHLLLAMLDNPSAAHVLRACGADMEELRTVLANHIDTHTPRSPGNIEVETQPTVGFQRVIQRAILHVQSSSKKEVTGANILVALFGEKESHAVYFLNQRGISRLDVVNYIAHGINKTPEVPSPKQSPDQE